MLLLRELRFEGEMCTGCSLCEKVCPNSAIQVLRDGDRFEVVVNDNCTLCGLCSDFCFYGAIHVVRDGETGSAYMRTFREELGFRKVDVDMSKCVYCGLCMESCPRNAIKVKRELDLSKIRGGRIEFRDRESCIECRLCVINCPTKAVRLEKGAPVINEDRCIYCEICSWVCPRSVIHIHCDSCRFQPERREIISGNVIVNEDLCSMCGICSEVCPENAITVTRLLEGKQHFDREKCYGFDCSICANICPNMAIHYSYTPEKNVEFSERCNYCGACEKFCPGDAIRIERWLSSELGIISLPSDINRRIGADRSKKAEVDEFCSGCGICESYCPLIKRGITMELSDGKLRPVDASKCTMCGLCAEGCPVESIRLREFGA